MQQRTRGPEESGSKTLDPTHPIMHPVAQSIRHLRVNVRRMSGHPDEDVTEQLVVLPVCLTGENKRNQAQTSSAFPPL